MATDLSQVIILTGNMGSDPTPIRDNGLEVTNFRMAVNRSWTGSDGVRHTETTWFRVAAWNALATKVVIPFGSKGRLVQVIGRLGGDKVEGNEEGRHQIVPHVYETSEGEYRAGFDIVADGVKFLGSGRGAAAAASDDFNDDSEDEPDIPF